MSTTRMKNYLDQMKTDNNISSVVSAREEKIIEGRLRNIQLQISSKKASHNILQSKKMFEELFDKEMKMIESCRSPAKKVIKHRKGGKKIQMNGENTFVYNNDNKKDAILLTDNIKTKLFGMSNTGVKQMTPWESLLEELKEYLRLFVGNPDDEKPKIDILRDISKNNPCCEVLTSYIERPQLIDQLQDRMICLYPEMPSNLKLLMIDIKQYLIERKEEYWRNLRNQVKIRDRISTISKTKILNKMLEKEFMVRSKETPERFIVMQNIASKDFLGFLKKKNGTLESITKRVNKSDKSPDLRLNMVNDFSKHHSHIVSNHMVTLKDPITEKELDDPSFGLSIGLKDIILNNRHLKIPLLDPSNIGIPSDADANRNESYNSDLIFGLV